ncbi:MAG: DUF6531 domain-containing protein [Acidobacteria bacterium]|nr:DUF6531 domain-containing protein [Acidobacteriota bacterium]
MPTASYYTVHRSYIIDGNTYTNSWTTAATTHEDNNVSNNVTFSYYVTAHNGTLVSPNSNVVSATPTLDAPQPTATTANGKVTVSWGSVTGATSYTLYRSNTGGNDYWAINGGSGTSADGGNVGYGNTYYFKVRAYNGGGYSFDSGVAAVYVDLSAPSGVTAVRVPVEKATISWGAVPDAIRYEVYRGTNPSSYGNFMGRSSVVGTSYLDTNVHTGQIIYYYVQSYGNAGYGRKSMIVGTDGSMHPCPPTEQCAVPVDRPVSGEAGASFNDPVNLATGAESFTHAPDLSVYNPTGPSAVWQRQYFSYQGVKGYASPGLSQGWAHTYDVFLEAPTGVWGALKLNYYNGGVETLTPVLDGSGQPTGAFTVPAGAPYFVSGVAGATTGEWQSVTITWRDQAQWRFTLLSSGIYPLSRISNRMGGGINLSWNGSRALTQVSDVASSATLLTLSYGGNGMLASVTDAYSRQVVYGYSIPFSAAPGMLQSVSQVVAAGTTTPPVQWTYGYTTNGQLLNTITVPSPTGSGTSTATINYDLLGKVTSLVDANGNQRIYTYGTTSTVVQVKNAANTVVQSWTQKFNAQRNTGLTDANNKSTVVEYNDPLNPSKATRVIDKNNKETLYTYDQHGNVLTVTNPRNIATTYTWSYTAFPLGRLTSVQEGTKPATTVTYYEPSGLVQSVTSPSPAGSGTVTKTFTYDSLGNILTVTGPGNNAASQIVTTYNYTTDGAYTQPAQIGQPVTITDNLGHVTHLRYDSHGRVTSVKDALGYETNATYNLVGQPEQVLLPATGQTGTGRGRSVNSYLYTGGPLLTNTVYNESNAQARQVSRAYGLEGELLSVTGGTEPASYTYDALYRLKTLEDGNNNTTTYNYNGVGNLISVQMPGGETMQFPSYDDAGHLLQRIDGNNVTTNYLYNDAENLLTDIQYPATPALNVHFGYDNYGRRTSMTDGAGSHGYSYNDADALTGTTTTYTGLPAQAVSYLYYPNGSRQNMITPAGTFSYSYDVAGRASSLTNPFGETSTWAYFDNNRVRTQTLANGAQTTYGYNAAEQMTGLLNEQGGFSLSNFGQIAYNGAGNRQSLMSGGTTYLYDMKQQLTQEQRLNSGTTDTFAYDGAGNAISFKGVTKTYNANNQQTGAGFTHDANGNPTTYKGTSGAASSTPLTRRAAWRSDSIFTATC